MQKISTNTLTTRKHVEIDGHAYTVRKFGAGEQLRLNQLLREAEKLEKQLKDVKDDPELERQALQMGSDIIEIFVGLFDDGEGGEKSRALVESLSQEEINLLFKQIFNDAEAKKPEPTAPENSATPATQTA